MKFLIKLQNNNVFQDFINTPQYFRPIVLKQVMQNDHDTNISQGKRKQQIDDNGPLSKKMLRNQRKKKNKQEKNDQQSQNYIKQSLKITQSNNKVKTPLNKQQKLQSLTQQLKNVYVECSKNTIRKFLIQADFNMELAANLIIQALAQQQNSMLDVFDKDKDQDNNTDYYGNINKNKKQKNKDKYCEQSNKNKNKNNKNKNIKKYNQTQQQGYKLLNQFYDKASQIDISGFQFEQLFNQITQIIKQDQRSKGKGLIQINNFVQLCMTAKQTILVGLKDVFEMQDIYIDQNDPIYIQLQQYTYDLTQKQVKQQVIKAEDFPTFGEASNKKKNQQNKNGNSTNDNKKQDNSHKQSIVNSLQNQNKYLSRPITKDDYFTGSKKRPVLFQQKNSKGIFNIDNQQQSQDALRGLHKEYNHVSIQSLKVAYLFFQRNYNECRIFLNKYYGQYAKDQKKIQYETNFVKNPRKNSFKKHLNFSSKKESIDQIDEQLKQMTFSQIRAEIQHLYNLRQVFNMTCNKINNTNQKKQLKRMQQEKAPADIIRKLSRAARVLLIQQTMQRNPNFVDLHGHREQEIDAILQGLVSSIKDQFNKGNVKVKYKMVGGRTEAVLQIMTGKGRHSIYGKSILKPCVKKWCDSRNIRAIVNEDNVEIYIPLL